jgi:hypothetical protein
MNSPSRQPADAAVRLGLREHLGQFALLILVNAFVGAMVGWHRQRWTNNGLGFRLVKRLAPNLPMDEL